jgi:hypothetical protein
MPAQIQGMAPANKIEAIGKFIRTFNEVDNSPTQFGQSEVNLLEMTMHQALNCDLGHIPIEVT